MTKTTIALVAVVLAVAGCATHIEPITPPDRRLLADCPVPVPDRDIAGKILVGATVSWSADLLGALLKCNEDKASLRAYFDGGRNGERKKD